MVISSKKSGKIGKVLVTNWLMPKQKSRGYVYFDVSLAYKLP